MTTPPRLHVLSAASSQPGASSVEAAGGPPRAAAQTGSKAQTVWVAIVSLALGLLLGFLLLQQPGLSSGVAAFGQGAEALARGGAAVSQRRACVVLAVYDGDTLACDLNGNGQLEKPEEKIRLLGIDASEMHYSRKNKSGRNEPFAAEAKAVLEAYLEQPLWLEFDQVRLDRYGRTLAYVYPSATASYSLNEALLAQGLARVLFLGANRRDEALAWQAAVTAQQKQLGLYGVPQRSAQ